MDGPGGGILSLQREAGNTAVTRLIGAGTRAIQRSVEAKPTSKAGETLKGDAGGLEIHKDLAVFADVLDQAVMSAWQLAVKNPAGCPALVPDGYVTRWASQWAEYETKADATIAGLVPAMCGYAIESLATKWFLSKGSTTWTGTNSGRDFQIALQVTHGNTRPDVVLSLGGRELGWYDITAEASKGHIDGKAGGGWKDRPYVAEICYPSVRVDTVQSESAAWAGGGSPDLTAGAKPADFANYWLELARYELLRGHVRTGLGGTGVKDAGSIINLARAIAGDRSQERRREYQRHAMRLYQNSTIDHGVPADALTAHIAASVAADPGDLPTPKEAAAVINVVYGNYQNFGWKSQGKPTYKSLPTRPGEAWIAACAQGRGIAVTDAEAAAKARLMNPASDAALTAVGL